MSCGLKTCEAAPETPDDAFCAKHWRALPRWARLELLALRNEARRGSHRAIREFGMAAYAAARLIEATAEALGPSVSD